MKVYRFLQEDQTVLNPSSRLLLGLRHGKIMINTLLRWCSAGLVSSYILTVTAGIYFYNQLALTSVWVPYLILILFASLLIGLLYIQYLYSEKRTENFFVSDSGIKLNPFSVKDCYKNNQRLTGIYVMASFAAWLIMTGLLFSDQQTAKGLFMLSGLALYGFGLFMIRSLLKEKCVIRQMISKLR